MLEIVKAGGWLMLPIILCSVVAAAIILERLWTLRRKRVLPEDLTARVWSWAHSRQLDDGHLKALSESSPLGMILSVGLQNRHRSREIMKEAVEDNGRHVVHELQRYLNSLGTIGGVARGHRSVKVGRDGGRAGRLCWPRSACRCG